MKSSLFDQLCRIFVFWLAWLILIASIDWIDFHVCIKPAGHCKIIDPTEVEK